MGVSFVHIGKKMCLKSRNTKRCVHHHHLFITKTFTIFFFLVCHPSHPYLYYFFFFSYSVPPFILFSLSHPLRSFSSYRFAFLLFFLPIMSQFTCLLPHVLITSHFPPSAMLTLLYISPLILHPHLSRPHLS